MKEIVINVKCKLGNVLQPGTEVEVDDSVADRLINRGLASLKKKQKPPKKAEQENEE